MWIKNWLQTIIVFFYFRKSAASQASTRCRSITRYIICDLYFHGALLDFGNCCRRSKCCRAYVSEWRNWVTLLLPLWSEQQRKIDRSMGWPYTGGILFKKVSGVNTTIVLHSSNEENQGRGKEFFFETKVILTVKVVFVQKIHCIVHV